MNAGRAAPLTVHIDRLVVDAAALGPLRLDGPARAALRSGLERDLAGKLADAGGGRGLAGAGAVAALRGAELKLPTDADAPHLGRALAQALADAIDTERRR